MNPILHDPALRTEVRRWPLRQPFAISRHVFHDNLVLQAEVDCGGQVGRGECEPHEFDETATRAAARELLAVHRSAWAHLDPMRMNAMVPRCAWRSALDSALWDLRAKLEGRRVWEILGIDMSPDACFPIYQTLSLDTPDRMAAAAAASRAAPGLKVKLGGADGRDAERLEAIRGAGGNEVLGDVAHHVGC